MKDESEIPDILIGDAGLFAIRSEQRDSLLASYKSEMIYHTYTSVINPKYEEVKGVKLLLNRSSFDIVPEETNIYHFNRHTTDIYLVSPRVRLKMIEGYKDFLKYYPNLRIESFFIPVMEAVEKGKQVNFMSRVNNSVVEFLLIKKTHYVYDNQEVY